MNISEKLKEIDTIELAADRIRETFALMVEYSLEAWNKEPANKVSKDWQLIIDYYNKQTA